MIAPTQMTLFPANTARARRTDPDTSHEAAAVVDVLGLEDRVLKVLAARGPLTAKEVAEILEIPQVSASPRFSPLAEKGLIKRTGQRRGRGELWEVVR